MRSPRGSYPILAAIVSLSLLPSATEAQFLGSTRRSAPLFTVGGDVIMSQPKGDLARYIDRGYGGNVTGLLRVSPDGLLYLIGDVGWQQYGSEHQRVPILARSGRVTVDLTTRNIINWFGVGLQFVLPTGPVRPYANATLGLTRFNTSSVLRDRQSDEEFGHTDHATDYTRAWAFGGGLYVPLSRRSHLGLNIGGRYFQGGEATYLPEGGITDNPDGTITLNTVRSKTDFVLWQVGVSVGLPPRSRAATAP